MLRQIHIIQGNAFLFSYSYALALGDIELQNVLKLLEPYIEMPMEGKTLKLTTSNFLLFHRAFKGLIFLIIADLSDSLNYIENILKKIIRKFSELFPKPNIINENDALKRQFVEFLKPLQHELHSKIAIIGPINSGKTTLYNLLKSGSERQILNFAKSAAYIIDSLNFDIWDFQLQDNFSLLWSKFVRGSDLIILLFDLSNYQLRVIEFFKNLYRNECKFSRLLILGNKADLVDEQEIKRIKNELELENFETISLIKPEVKNKLDYLISKILGLKKALPANFNELVKNAEDLEVSGNLTLAIAKYKELAKLCDQCQELALERAFQEKIDKLQKQVNEDLKSRRLEAMKKKFEFPSKITFTSRIRVKPLPADKNKIKEEIKSKVHGVSIQPTSSIGFVDFSEEKKVESRTQTSPATTIQTTTPSSKQAVVPAVKREIPRSEYPQELQKMIEERGGHLSLKLCQQLIEELEKTLSREIKIEDLEMAADIFVKQELS